MNLVFDPLLPINIILLLFLALMTVRLLAKIGNLTSFLLFLGAGLAFLILAINPQKDTNGAKTLPGIVAIIADESQSMKAANRIETLRKTKAELEKKLLNQGFLIRSETISDNRSFAEILTRLLQTINPQQISGAFILTDGQMPKGELGAFNFPINQIIIGEKSEHDRFIRIVKPAIGAEIGKFTNLKIEVKDNIINSGDAAIELQFAGMRERRTIPLNKEINLEIPIIKSGKQEIAISTPVMTGEKSVINNAIITEIEGIFDRLQVLLINGEPYEGLRSWRALLKSDPSIDLVHFTILRGPDKEDFAAQDEISLIPFPVEELFYEKLSSFNLIIIDRFMAQDVLRNDYLENIAQYVNDGGALLSVLGSYDTKNEGILNTPLATILPISDLPVLEATPFKPAISQNATDHPIVKGLETSHWGRWDTYFKTKTRDEVILSANSDPLLTIRDQGKGRVAVLLSENSWYWARGIDGGGPFRDLIGRTIHYLLKDPQFEKQKLELNGDFERISANIANAKSKLLIRGANFSDEIASNPDLTQEKIELSAREFGLYTAKLGDLSDYAILGNDIETIGISNAAKEMEFPKQSFGGQVFTNGSFQPVFKILENRPMLNDQNDLVLLKPKLKATSSQTRPLFNPLLVLLLSVFLLLFSWYFEGAKSNQYLRDAQN